jgi:hypothetical protein
MFDRHIWAGTCRRQLVQVKLVWDMTAVYERREEDARQQYQPLFTLNYACYLKRTDGQTDGRTSGFSNLEMSSLWQRAGGDWRVIGCQTSGLLRLRAVSFTSPRGLCYDG